MSQVLNVSPSPFDRLEPAGQVVKRAVEKPRSSALMRPLPLPLPSALVSAFASQPLPALLATKQAAVASVELDLHSSFKRTVEKSSGDIPQARPLFDFLI